jgi:signal transduction histidine kinase
MIAQLTRKSKEPAADWLGGAPSVRERDLEARLRAAEDRLAEADNDLVRALRLSHTCIYETGRDLRLTRMLGTAEDVIGVAPTALIGKKFAQFLVLGQGPSEIAVAVHRRRAFKNLVYCTRTGARYLRITGKPQFDADGAFCGYHGAISDATGRVEAEQRAADQYRRFREAIECIPASLMLFDADDRLVICNSATQHFFPLAKDLLVPGTPFEELLRADIERGHLWKTDKSVDEFVAERVARHRAANTDVIGALPDGRWIQVIERPTTEGGVIGIRMNISELKQTEAELEEKSRQLEEHGRELKRSNTELEQFAYVASHDLQEPLRMVASYCQLLKRRYAGKLDSDADDFIGFAVEGAGRMQRLINDLLTYSRVGRRGESFVRLRLDDIVKASLTNLEAAIADAGATIDMSDLPEIMGDPTQLAQLFQNLIGNAIKFRRDDPPLVRIAAAPAENGFAEITVEDNGIGIEREYVEKVFLIFQRLHGRDKYSGTGIGLAIVKKVVEHHGGKVWIDSTPGQGSRFRFTLPLVQGG